MEDTNWRRKSLIELIIRFLSIICLKCHKVPVFACSVIMFGRGAGGGGQF